MHWQQSWQLSCNSDSRSLGSSPLLPHQQCLLIHVMFRPWMLLARGPRRSEQRNPVGEEGGCCQGQHASYALSLPSNSTEAMALIVQCGPTASSLLSRRSRCNFEPPRLLAFFAMCTILSHHTLMYLFQMANPRPKPIA
jgi:hypothetical protein